MSNEDKVCPNCFGPIQPTHIDDVGTQWFKCQKCGEPTSQPVLKPKQRKKVTMPECNTCIHNTDNEDNCPFIGEQVDGLKCTKYEKVSSSEPSSEFNPVKFAKILLAENTFKTTRDTETLYVYDPKERIYKTTGEVLVKERMAERLDEDTRQRYFADVIFYIKGMTYFDRPPSPKDKLAVENGILNVVTRELTTDSKDDFITVKLPRTYDSNADCPTIKKFLVDVVGPEQALLIQEFTGYCLYQLMFVHKAFMFVGNGANGKSTLLDLLRAFLGESNVSNVTLQALCGNRFAPAQVYGKLANLCADIPDKPLEYTGMFKMLTGNDAVMIEEKFKRGFSIVNTAKLAFSTNKVPESMDDTDAFFRRWIIISCNNVFVGPKCDKHIIEKITTPAELSGFLNYALDGLKRLLEKGEFSQVEDLEKLRTQYIRQSNSAKSYIEEKLEASNNDKDIIVERDLYEKYITFCVSNNLPTMKKRNFTENMQQYLPRAKQSMVRIEGKGVHVWQFLKFVTAVTSSLLNHINNETTEKCGKEESKDLVCIDEYAVTVVTPNAEVANHEVEEERVCGHCAVWHKPGCSYPDGESSCVAPTNRYAADCRDYIPKEGGSA